MSYRLLKLFLKLTPKSLKTFILKRIVASISQKIIEKWSRDTLEPLHQKIIRLEKEVKKIKKMHDN